MPDFLPPSRTASTTGAGHGGLVIAGVTLGLALAAGGIALAGSDRPTSTSATDVPEIAWGEGQAAGTPSVDAAQDVSELPELSSGDVVVANTAAPQPTSGASDAGWPVSSTTGRSAAPLTLSVSWAGAPTRAAAPDVATPPVVVSGESNKPRKPTVTAPPAPVQPAPTPEVVLASGERTAPPVPVAPVPVAPAPAAPAPVVPAPVVDVPVVEVPVVEVPVVEGPAEEVPVVEVPAVEEPPIVDEPETTPEAPEVCEAPTVDPEVGVEVGVEVRVEVGDASGEPVATTDGCEAAPEEGTAAEDHVTAPVIDVEVPVDVDEAVAAQEVEVAQA